MNINYVKKVNEHGEVAIIYSPHYGAGWSSWKTNNPSLAKALLFDSDLVNLVLAEKNEEITNEYLQAKYDIPDLYVSGQKDLEIMWLKPDTIFEVEEFDGKESVNILYRDDVYIA